MNFKELLILAPILIATLTIHEYSHGLVAWRLGDDTAKRAGRLTLNPLSHLDIFGLIMLFIAHFGWAKPVPINPYNFRNFKRDTAITAAAGPASNFLLAIVAGLGVRGFYHLYPSITPDQHFPIFVIFIGMMLVFYNLALGLFNLIPIPPLDGSKILGGFLSDRAYFKYTAREREGMAIFMGLMLVDYLLKLHIVSTLIDLPLNFLLQLLIGSDYPALMSVLGYVFSNVL
jgi:Zn-dependent protease